MKQDMFRGIVRTYSLESIVFLTGFVVMVLEIVGSRFLGPYVGTSIYVWTSLIGVILGCLSLGYWWGGKLADHEPNKSTLSRILFVSALFVTLISLIHGFVTEYIVGLFPDIRISATISSILLFGPPSVLLGMVTPYTVKLRIHSLAHSGETVGRLYAISTLGSIVGTFMSGFVLLSFIGSTHITFILAVILFCTSLIAGGSMKYKEAALFLGALGFAAYAYSLQESVLKNLGIIAVDTQYNHIRIVNGKDTSGRAVRIMKINNENSSARYMGSSDPVFGYFRYYDLFDHFVPGATHTLMIGGAGYAYPAHFLDMYQDKRIDVVEIDPAMETLARKYFELPSSPRLRIINQDGRVFLNQARNDTYDVIFGDAYASFYTLPFHLTTIESTRRMYDVLKNGGAVIVNIIGSINGDTGKFLRAEYRTFASVFPHVLLFTTATRDPLALQNIMLVALKSEKVPEFESGSVYMRNLLSTGHKEKISNDMPVLYDDFAPVDRYMAKAVLRPL